MGLISAIIGWLQYHLGLRTDAASSSGSLHAKVTELRNNYLPTELAKYPKLRGYGSKGAYSTSSTSYVTALNVSGKGCLKILTFFQNVKMSVKLTIDGTEVFYGLSQDTGSIALTIGSSITGADNGLFLVSGGSPLIDINFKTNLKIEIKTEETLGLARVFWYYEIE